MSILWGEFKLSFGEENVGAKMDVSNNNKCELNEASKPGDSSNAHIECSDAKTSKDEFFAEFAVFMYFYWAIVIGICVVVAMWFFSSLRGGNQLKNILQFNDFLPNSKLPIVHIRVRLVALHSVIFKY